MNLPAGSPARVVQVGAELAENSKPWSHYLDTVNLDMNDMQELVAIDERGSREKRAFVTSYMHYLLPVLLLDQREEQLQEVATCLGTILAWQCNLT